MIKVEFHSLTS